MEVYPELLTEMAIGVAKDYFRADGKKDLAQLIADAMARFERTHKAKLTNTHLRTVCQMANRAVHKNAFKKDRLVKFDLATVARVRAAASPKEETPSAALELPALRSQGRRRVISSAPKTKKKPKIPIRDKLPGRRSQTKLEKADVLRERLGDLSGVLTKATRNLTPEEILGLAVVLDGTRGSSVLTNLLSGVFEKQASVDFEKVASYTGMTPEKDHPVVAAMGALLDAAEDYKEASRRLEHAWVG